MAASSHPCETKDVSVTQKMVQNLCFTYALFNLLNPVALPERQLKVASFAFTTRLSAVSLSFFLLKKGAFFFSFLIPKHCLLKYTHIHLFMWLHQVIVVAPRIFSCDVWDLVPRPRIKLRPPAWGAPSLSH